jgi:hypothetical protein
MEKPNVDEKKWAMGFHIGTTIMQGILKRPHKRILGQVMPYGSHYLTWILSFGLGRTKSF